ncbi:MAG: glycosyltransferase family 2 protein [Candidatus Brocadiia bacterium]
MPDLSVIVPVHNEEPAVGDVVRELHAVLAGAPEVGSFEVLVVDDGSTDGTAEAVRQAAEGKPQVRLLQRPRNRGYGDAVKHGLRQAAHDLVAICDGDGTYPAEKLPEMVREMADAAMVVGARSRAGAIPFIRRPAKRLLTALASYLAEERIPDLNSGLRVFRKQACLRFLRLLPPRFSFTTTLTLALLCEGQAVKYVPIDYRPRAGTSKIRPVRDTLAFFLLVATTITYFRPLKVLVPLAAVLFVAGLVKGTVDVAVEANLKTSDLLLLVAGVQLFALALLADLVAKTR